MPLTQGCNMGRRGYDRWDNTNSERSKLLSLISHNPAFIWEHMICAVIVQNINIIFKKIFLFGEERQTRQSGFPFSCNEGRQLWCITEGIIRICHSTLGGSAPTRTAGKVRAKAKAEVVRLIVEVGFRLFVCDLSQTAAYPHVPPILCTKWSTVK